MRGCLLGPGFPQGEIEARLAAAGAIFQVLDDEALVRATVDALVDARVVGWFQGRMEYGPRALGARSILADPRVSDMRERVNRTIKRRESFRPFAPSVLSEDLSDWFELACDSPYMLLVADVARDRRFERTSETGAPDSASLSEIPAVTHVDYSARIQTVHRETNPRYHALLSGFKERTGCPVLLNTSFNVRDEPLVCTPEDAFRCFLNAEIDVLVVGNALMRAEEQSPALRDAYRCSLDAP
jgi:carbamoyltransferase